VRILLVEDTEDDASRLLNALREEGFDPSHRRVLTVDDLRSALAHETWDVVISEFAMPGFSGLEALRILQSTGLDIPFLVVSGTMSEAAAVAAMKAGATDYVMKQNLARLAPALLRELKDAKVRAAHRRAQASLTESEERFRQLAENISDVFFLKDAQSNRLLYISPAYAEISGLSCESALAKPDAWFEAIHPDDLAAVREKQHQGRESGLFDYEFRIVRNDGSHRFIEARGFPVRDDSGRIVRIAGIAKDITERKRSELDLRESDRRFSELIGNVEMISLMLDHDARITYCNDYLLRLTGWLQEEVIGQDWFALFVPEDSDMRDVFSALLENQPASWHHESEILTRAGQPRLIRWNFSLLRSGAGEVTGVASMGEDVTERVQAQLRIEQASIKLRRSEGIKASILESSLDSIVSMDHEGCIVEFNSASEAVFGWTRAEVLGKSLEDLIVPRRFRDAHRRGLSNYLSSGVGPMLGKRLELSALRANGSEFPIELAIAEITASPTPMFTAFIRDISERRESEARLKGLNRVYAVLSGINTLIVRARSRDELFEEACIIAVEKGRFPLAWVGVVQEGRLSVPLAAWAGGAHAYRARVEALLSKPATAFAGMQVVITEARVVVVNDIATDPRVCLRDEALASGFRSLVVMPLVVGGKVVALFNLCAEEMDFFDDEELKLLSELSGDLSYALEYIGQAERLDYLAYFDPLTGLANRTLLLDRLAQYMSSATSAAQGVALVLFDIERFKNFNDSLGRTTGDALLKHVGDWLTRTLGDANLLAHVGSGHFAVMLPDMHQADGVARFLEISRRTFLANPFRVDGAELTITAKVGVAMFPDDGADAETLFKHAESALRKAKSSGERYVFYTQKMTDMVAGKLSLENRLRRALENEEFVLHYQPKLSFVTGAVTGAEALIRWNDPLSGLVPPGKFIPILEETGLISEVGRWALRKALEEHLRWREAGWAAVRIAVNVSPLQLRNAGFVAELQEAIAVGACAAAGLELEITEGMIMDDVSRNTATLKAIREMGICIAVDDFGTGFSSLAYLSRLPVDTLKIDRAFVNDMTVSPEGLALVSTIITLAHSLKLKVVAEGVETEAESRTLRALGCDEMQGFLFAKAVPGDVFEANFLTRAA